MVLTLLLIARKTLNLEEYITIQHIELMNKIIILTGSIVGIAYITELFISWYSGVEYEGYAFYNQYVFLFAFSHNTTDLIPAPP